MRSCRGSCRIHSEVSLLTRMSSQQVHVYRYQQHICVGCDLTLAPGKCSITACRCDSAGAGVPIDLCQDHGCIALVAGGSMGCTIAGQRFTEYASRARLLHETRAIDFPGRRSRQTHLLVSCLQEQACSPCGTATAAIERTCWALAQTRLLRFAS